MFSPSGGGDGASRASVGCLARRDYASYLLVVGGALVWVKSSNIGFDGFKPWLLMENGERPVVVR